MNVQALYDQNQVAIFDEPDLQHQHQHRLITRIIANQRTDHAFDETIEQAAIADDTEQLQYTQLIETTQTQTLGKTLRHNQDLAHLTQTLNETKYIAANTAQTKEQT